MYLLSPHLTMIVLAEELVTYLLNSPEDFRWISGSRVDLSDEIMCVDTDLWSWTGKGRISWHLLSVHCWAKEEFLWAGTVPVFSQFHDLYADSVFLFLQACSRGLSDEFSVWLAISPPKGYPKFMKRLRRLQFSELDLVLKYCLGWWKSPGIGCRKVLPCFGVTRDRPWSIRINPSCLLTTDIRRKLKRPRQQS